MRLFRRFAARASLSCALVFATAGMALAATSGIQKESLTFEGRKHTFYLFIPDTPSVNVAVPLIVLLHSVGQGAPSLANPWSTLASKEGLILLAPEAANRLGWDIRDDHPDFFRELIESVKAMHALDPRRVYIFGQSNGGVYALTLALLESRYFAAVAVHAAALCSPQGDFLPCSSKDLDQMIEGATRKIPVALWSGTFDRQIPLQRAQGSEIILEEHGFPVELHAMPGRTQNYYEHADEVDEAVWTFLRQHQLDDRPQFQSYKC
jgi:poly(3-hydroxybutyrate) depolymerase